MAELGRRKAQKNDQDCRAHLEESVASATEAVRFLQNEPTALCEGQICKQALMNVESLKVAIDSIE